MSSLTRQEDYSGYLLKDGVSINFETAFINQTFRHFLALKVPLNDVVKFFHKAQKTGADPVMEQIFLIPRSVKNKDGSYSTVGTIVFNYHFLEMAAQKTGEFEGYKVETGVGDYFDPISGEFKKTLKSHCIVKRKGSEYSFTAWWPEYVQTNYKGEPNATWATKGHLMLEKCAKSGALRSAFPEWVQGYSREEMGAIEKENDYIEAEFEQLKEANKILTKIEGALSLEDMDEIDQKVDLIQVELSRICQGMNINQKGKFLVENTGARSINDLKKRPISELETILTKLQGM